MGSHKARSNREKHGVSFEEAATVFHDPMAVTIYDPDHAEHEERWITIEISKTGRLLILSHTFKIESEEMVAIRIFSSRKATKRETERYEEQQ